MIETNDKRFVVEHRIGNTLGMRLRRTLESHYLQIQFSLSVGAFYNFRYKISKTSIAYQRFVFIYNYRLMTRLGKFFRSGRSV